MKKFYHLTALDRFRLIALLEGISFLVLLCIAMPLKYFAHIPEAVKVTGWLHGLLFILYFLTLVPVAIEKNWSLGKLAFAFIAAFIPFGTFIFDKNLKKEKKENQTKQTA